MKNNKKIIIVVAIILLLVIFVAIFVMNNKTIEWNGEYEYYHIALNYDETNMYETVGTVDYIFIGTVEEVINNKVDYNSSKDYAAYSNYKIKVEDNLKGNLKEEIKCYVHGGYLKDGTLLYPKSDNLENKNNVLQLGKKYIFMAFGQQDGKLVLEEFYGATEYVDVTQKEKYMEYIDNEIIDNRERFLSIYDKNSNI